MLCVCWGEGGEGGGGYVGRGEVWVLGGLKRKLVLHARNFPLNSDAAQNYKYGFSFSHTYLISETST